MINWERNFVSSTSVSVIIFMTIKQIGLRYTVVDFVNSLV